MSHHLMSRIQQVVDESCIKTLGHKVNIQITLKSDMKKIAGMAYMTSKKIDLNQVFLDADPDAFIKRTVVHEAAHIITSIKFPKAKQHHGPEFRSVMRDLGADESTYHKYDLSLVGVKRYKYTCGCQGRILQITPAIHKKMQAGEKRYCGKCGERAIFMANEGTP